jgi:biotin carboxyl carrier protein
VTVEVDIGGRVRRIELDRAGEQWVARVGGRSLHVDARRVGAGWSLLFGDTLTRSSSLGQRRLSSGSDVHPRTSYDVTLESERSGLWIARVNGEPIPARVVDPRVRRREGRGSATGGGSRLVTSAMPGRVIRVLVKAGDRLVERQALVVVEAMKMENELRAPGDAIVRDVNVTEGMSVDAGAILIVLE